MLKKSFIFALFVALSPLSLFAESSHFDKKSNTYTVQRGDCLWSISKDVLDDGLNWSFIYAANAKKIHNPGLIYPGEKLAIPTAITNELREKAAQMVSQLQESAPAPSAKKASPTTSSETSASPAAKPAAKHSASSAEAVPAAEETAKKPEESAPSSGGSTGLYLLIAAVLALAGGIYFWKRDKFTSPAEPQKPQPLSSFPKTTTSFQPKPTSPSPSNGSTSSQSPATEPRSFEATITSISTPAPTSIAKEEPKPSQLAAPTTPKPSEPVSQSQPSQPTTQPSAAPSAQPASSPSTEKPQDPANPSSSGPQNN